MEDVEQTNQQRMQVQCQVPFQNTQLDHTSNKPNECSTYFKSVLRHLQNHDCRNYLTTQYQKKQLGYPQTCLRKNNNQALSSSFVLIGLAYFVSPQHIQLVLYLSKGQFYQLKYSGLISQDKCQNLGHLVSQKQLHEINSFINGNIVVGHDLGPLFTKIGIKHHSFIDTMALYPHHLGLPFRSTLDHIANSQLAQEFKAFSFDIKEQAVTAVKIVEKHIKLGKGTQEQFQTQKFIMKQQTSFLSIIRQAQLEQKRIVGFFLRGSRALGWQIEDDDYVSDWDFFCVYETQTIINGKLITLWNIDITIYDVKSFQKLMKNNDIALLDLFFLPKKFQYVNHLKYPQINLQWLRQSLELHLGKCERKLKRFWATYRGIKRDWKMLKVGHYKIRFIHYFIELFHKNAIDFTHITALWNKVAQVYRQTRKYSKAWEILAKQLSIIAEKLKIIQQNNKQISLRKSKVLNHSKAIHLHQQSKNQHQKMQVQLNAQTNPLCLNIVKQLLSFGLQRLESLTISYNRHKLYPNLIQFHYNQSSDFKNPICKEVRGIIVDQFTNYSIVCLPYFKFFDYNDSRNSQVKLFNFNSFKVYQKLDGSIACLYQYMGRWHVSSSRVPDGSNNYCFAKPQTTTTFESQFWKIFYQNHYSLPRQQHKNKTFVFELLSKDHIVVVQRNQSSLVLHGVRDRKTGVQEDHDVYGFKYGWQYTKPLEIQKSLQQLVEMSKYLNPLKQQGFLLCDDKYIKMKVKSPAYIKANWLAELNLSPDKNPRKYLLEIILAGEGQLFVQYCPEWAETIKQFKAKILELNKTCIQFQQQNALKGAKELAEIIKSQNSSLQPFLFAICNNPQKWANRLETLLQPKKLLSLLETMK